MYCEHFGLRELPFALTPDTGYTYLSRSHRDAHNTVRMALASGEGFVKVTGEVGTGKTLLARGLREALEQEGAVTAFIPNPSLTGRELLRELATEFKLKPNKRAATRDLYESVSQCISKHGAAGRAVVLVVDEAQAMPAETVECLRLLSNLETAKRRLLQVVFFGQPELDALLATPLCRSLASRIAFSAHLLPMQAHDFGRYLQHRLHVAGWRGPQVFSAPAAWLLARASAGVPRRTNILAHKALLLAYGANVHRVGLPQALGSVFDGHHGWRRRAAALGSGAGQAARA